MSNRRAQDERIEGTPDGVNAITEIVDVPDAPTIGTATAGMANASVPFTAATTGGTVSTFTAISSPGSFTGTSATSPITVSGLTAGTSYTFTVRGTNSTGTGSYSSSSNSIVPDPVMERAYDSLISVALSTTTEGITFSGIPTGYKHLQVRAIVRSAAAAVNDDFLVRFNSDSGSNYVGHALYGSGSSAGATITGTTSTTTLYQALVAGNSLSANIFGSVVMDVLDYENINKYKTVRTFGGYDDNSTNGHISLRGGLWMSNSAITSITISGGSSWLANSSFALYGVK
jgi:hypothetical protein